MNNERTISTRNSFPDWREVFRINFEPDIHLTDENKINLNRCLFILNQMINIPIVLNCSLLTLSSFSNSFTNDRESIRFNHYLRVRQPKKFYWIRNIKTLYLYLRSPSHSNDEIRANLIEIHCRKRIPLTSRKKIEQKKPTSLNYSIEDRCLKLNIRGENSLLQLNFSSDLIELNQLPKGYYYKWCDDSHIRSTTIQFSVDCSVENDYRSI